MSWLEWLIDKLTLLYLRPTHGKVVEKEDYSAEGVSKRIYWYRDDDSIRAGHCTPFNTITMNKGAMEEYSDRYFDYVFLHEAGHASWHLLIHIILTPLLIGSLILAGLSLLLPLLWATFVYISTQSISYTTLHFVLSIIFIVTPSVLLVMIFSFIEEGHAELFALNKIGEEAYLECHEERKEKSEAGMIRKAVNKILYPPKRMVLRVHRFRHSE